jgi:hypothetical protein
MGEVPVAPEAGADAAPDVVPDAVAPSLQLSPAEPAAGGAPTPTGGAPGLQEWTAPAPAPPPADAGGQEDGPGPATDVLNGTVVP